MPKKQKNSFYFFMKELQDEYKSEGKIISMKEMPAIAHPKWKILSDKEKLKYEKMAKDYKQDSRENVAGKICSDGTPLIYAIKADQEEQEKAEEAMKFVEKFISQMESLDQVMDSPFFIMFFNVLCCTDEEEFIPLEVGIAKYSIRKGIEDHFHVFIEPGPIPIGYTRVSMQHSEETHKIPVSEFELSEQNYSKICRNIENFVNPKRNEIAPVFCIEDNIKQNQSCLDWLHRKVTHCNLDSIQYYSLTHLLMELRAYVDHAFPSKVIAADMLSTHAFDYIPNIRCDFHEDLDNPFCALSCAKRLCFILSDALCELYGIDCTPNHLPPRIGDNGEYETYKPKLPQPLPITNIVDIPVKPPKPHIITKIHKKEFDDRNLQHRFQTDSVASSCIPKRSNDDDEPEKFSKDDFPALSKPSAFQIDSSEMRQPNTLPFVLSKGICLNQDKRYAALSLGRGIGRGKQVP